MEFSEINNKFIFKKYGIQNGFKNKSVELHHKNFIAEQLRYLRYLTQLLEFISNLYKGLALCDRLSRWHHIGVLVQSLALLLISLPTIVPKKALKDDPSISISCFLLRFLDRVVGAWFGSCPVRKEPHNKSSLSD